MQKNVEDSRGGRILFVSHCVLNQNAKVRGIAKSPGMIRPVVELLLEKDIAVFQMPCPEMTYLGGMRWGQVKDQYDSPMFRRHCRKITDEVLDQVEEYRRSGYEVLGFVMIDGSPVCGLKKTPRPVKEEEPWGGMTWYVPESRTSEEPGVFCEVLQAEVERRGLSDLPFVSVPEVDEVGSLEDSLQEILALL